MPRLGWSTMSVRPRARPAPGRLSSLVDHSSCVHGGSFRPLAPAAPIPRLVPPEALGYTSHCEILP
jgi:hypothetical protein